MTSRNWDKARADRLSRKARVYDKTMRWYDENPLTDEQRPEYPPQRCWCGKELNHDWPGKESGEYHPKE